MSLEVTQEYWIYSYFMQARKRNLAHVYKHNYSNFIFVAVRNRLIWLSILYCSISGGRKAIMKGWCWKYLLFCFHLSKSSLCRCVLCVQHFSLLCSDDKYCLKQCMYRIWWEVLSRFKIMVLTNTEIIIIHLNSHWSTIKFWTVELLLMTVQLWTFF